MRRGKGRCSVFYRGREREKMPGPGSKREKTCNVLYRGSHREEMPGPGGKDATGVFNVAWPGQLHLLNPPRCAGGGRGPATAPCTARTQRTPAESPVPPPEVTSHTKRVNSGSGLGPPAGHFRVRFIMDPAPTANGVGPAPLALFLFALMFFFVRCT